MLLFPLMALSRDGTENVLFLHFEEFPFLFSSVTSLKPGYEKIGMVSRHND
jgi:hypothetical protein